MEVIGVVLAPGVWLESTLNTLWGNYIYLVDTQKENIVLKNTIDTLQEELASTKESVEENKRLRTLLNLHVPDFPKIYARVIAVHYGAQAIVNTLLINKGSADGISLYDPVLSAKGLIGRVVRLSRNNAVVLPITAPESRLSVISQTNRVSAIVAGMGSGFPLQVFYVPRSDVIAIGEVLVTSGVDGVFPKGIPVGTISSIKEEELFYEIKAIPYTDKESFEEVLILATPKDIEGTGIGTSSASNIGTTQ